MESILGRLVKERGCWCAEIVRPNADLQAVVHAMDDDFPREQAVLQRRQPANPRQRTLASARPPAVNVDQPPAPAPQITEEVLRGLLQPLFEAQQQQIQRLEQEFKAEQQSLQKQRLSQPNDAAQPDWQAVLEVLNVMALEQQHTTASQKTLLASINSLQTTLHALATSVSEQQQKQQQQLLCDTSISARCEALLQQQQQQQQLLCNVSTALQLNSSEQQQHLVALEQRVDTVHATLSQIQANTNTMMEGQTLQLIPANGQQQLAALTQRFDSLLGALAHIQANTNALLEGQTMQLVPVTGQQQQMAALAQRFDNLHATLGQIWANTNTMVEGQTRQLIPVSGQLAILSQRFDSMDTALAQIQANSTLVSGDAVTPRRVLELLQDTFARIFSELVGIRQSTGNLEAFPQHLLQLQASISNDIHHAFPQLSSQLVAIGEEIASVGDALHTDGSQIFAAITQSNAFQSQSFSGAMLCERVVAERLIMAPRQPLPSNHNLAVGCYSPAVTSRKTPDPSRLQ